MRDVYQEVTDQIVGAVDSAEQWQPCWVGQAGMPRNAVTMRHYSGVNILLLWIAADAKGYGDQRWATVKQWNSEDCKVKQGERATWITLYKPMVRNEGQPDEKRWAMMREFPVFNAAQCEGELAKAPELVVLRDGQRFNEAEDLIIKTGATILNEGDQPCYIPKLDKIKMPLFERFHSPKNYYATLFHELGHWTGHESRLSRDLKPRFEKEAYAMEELVAELASSFVCAHLGIESSMREDHAPYIKNWLSVLRQDKTAITTAASAASKAADLIIGATPQQVTANHSKPQQAAA
jgi:antirestriction protein ArdC